MTAADNDFRLDTAVLLIGFNRMGPLRQVFEAVRQARPPRLYFAADGPRKEEERALWLRFEPGGLAGIWRNTKKYWSNWPLSYG